MIFLDIDYGKEIVENASNEEVQTISAEDKVKLISRATLDRRLNSRDLKLYNYVMSFEYLRCTQEEMSEMLDMSRSHINRSLEKLASFNYIEKVQLKQGIKKMAYKLKHRAIAGLIALEETNVIRVLNMSNATTDSDLKMFYCSQKELKEKEFLIEEYSRHIECIENDYNSEDKYKREKSRELVETFDPKGQNPKVVLEDLKSTIVKCKDDVEDSVEMREKLSCFSKNLKSKILNTDEVTEVLEDDNAKLILFLDRCEEEYAVNFREKYLENYIKFVHKFVGLDEKFFALYYENKRVELSFSELMRMLGGNHRDVPVRREIMIERVVSSLKELIPEKKDGLDNELESFIEEVEMLLDGNICSDGYYHNREISIILYAMRQTSFTKNVFGINFDSFMRIYNPDLFNVFAKIEELKKPKMEELKEE